MGTSAQASTDGMVIDNGYLSFGNSPKEEFTSIECYLLYTHILGMISVCQLFSKLSRISSMWSRIKIL